MEIDENDSSLNDTLIGDAVLTLLQAGKPVTVDGLVSQLNHTALNTKSSIIKNTCEHTITALQNSIGTAQNNKNYFVRDADNVLVQFSNEGQFRGKKNH